MLKTVSVFGVFFLEKLVPSDPVIHIIPNGKIYKYAKSDLAHICHYSKTIFFTLYCTEQ